MFVGRINKSVHHQLREVSLVHCKFPVHRRGDVERRRCVVRFVLQKLALLDLLGRNIVPRWNFQVSYGVRRFDASPAADSGQQLEIIDNRQIGRFFLKKAVLSFHRSLVYLLARSFVRSFTCKNQLSSIV